jgi:hypothetical protein
VSPLEPKEVAIGILDDELLDAHVALPGAVRASLHRDQHASVALDQSVISEREARVRNLQVDPSTERSLQHGAPKPTTGSFGLFEHEVGATQPKVEERFLGTAVEFLEPNELHIEPSANGQVAHVELGDQGGGHVHGVCSLTRPAVRWRRIALCAELWRAAASRADQLRGGGAVGFAGMGEIVFDDVVFTDYGQFDLVWTDDLGFDGDWDRSFGGQVNGLVGAAHGNGVYVNLARRSGGSQVRVSIVDTAPPLSEHHEDIVEVSVTIAEDADFRCETWAAESVRSLGRVAAGTYRVRVSARGRDAGRDGEFDDGVVDSYLIELWPAPFADDQIVRVGSEDAKYWHGEIGGRARRPSPS